MRRVVVTGMGIVSSIGNSTQEVLGSLREGRSGIVKSQKYADLGFRCQVHGAPSLNAAEVVDRRGPGDLPVGGAQPAVVRAAVHDLAQRVARPDRLDVELGQARVHAREEGAVVPGVAVLPADA